VLEVGARVVNRRRDRCLAGEMVDDVHPCHGALNNFAVANVALREGQRVAVLAAQPVEVQLGPRARKAVEDGDMKSVGEEIVGKIASEEAGASGYETAPIVVRAALFAPVRHRARHTIRSPAGVLARLVKLVLDLVPGSVIDRSRRVPVVAPLLRRLLGAVSRPLHGRAIPIAHGPAEGLVLVFDDTSAVWASGKTESAVQDILERLVGPASVFFDIGANVGFFTLLGARLVGPAGTVVAFEPHAGNLERLRRNIELNAFSNVDVVAKAVSDASGSRVLDARHSATAALLPADETRTDEGLARVDTTSIDDFLALRRELEPDVVKIDAEGHEVEIVHGMLETLRLCRPVLVCEMHGRNRDFAAALETAGYLTSSVGSSSARLGRGGRTHVLAAPRGHPALKTMSEPPRRALG
jgi:FkbM family methyltransferase